MCEDPHAKRKEQIRKYTETAVTEMLAWAQKNYKLDDNLSDLILKISFDHRRINHYGGWCQNKTGRWKPFLDFAFDIILDFKPHMSHEYEWYNADPIIGKIWIPTWKYYVRLIVAHEMSHVLEFSHVYLRDPDHKERLRKRFGRSKLSDDHSDTFQKIYKVMRRKFVNRINRTV